jgi:hypothetical protein
MKSLEKTLSGGAPPGGGGRGGHGGFSSDRVFGPAPEFCRKWANSGTCDFGSRCRWVSSHTVSSSAGRKDGRKEAGAGKEKRNKAGKKRARIRSPADSDSDS